MDQSIKDKLDDVIADRLGVSLSVINPETNMVDELGADSIDLIELVMAVEDELDIQIDVNVDGTELTTVQSVYDMVEKFL